MKFNEIKLIPKLLAAAFLAAGVAFSAVQAVEEPQAEVASSSSSTNLLSPGKDDPLIAYYVARLLQRDHYRQDPFDDDYSEKFFDQYINVLDRLHLHFTQEDIDEFVVWRTNLDDLTLARDGKADTTPAFAIFNRFFQRLKQRTEYATGLLQNEKFAFDGDQRVLADRRDAPFPANLDEAKKLWRERVQLEFLQEKLALISEKKKKTADAAKATTEQKSAADAPAKSDHEEIVDKLVKRYNRVLHFFEEWDSDDVIERYLSALASVYDPHSDYMGERQADNFAIGMSLSLFGIGAELKQDEDGYCVISKLHPGPAFKSKKIKEEDKIIAVAQAEEPPVDIVNMALTKAVQLIRGPKDTEVRLTIIPADNPSEQKVVSLIRDEIKLNDQAAKAQIIDFPSGNGKTVRMGVIDLPSFYATVELSGAVGHPERRSTTEDVAKLIRKLEEEKVEGIILDLRRNGGGSLEEVINLTGLFIKEGPVVQVAGPGTPVFVDGDDDPAQLYAGPLVVLTSRFSASASEILAGALQDYGRAVIVGDISTHGKGTVQNVNPLARWMRTRGETDHDPGVLKTTIRKFYRASGASTQLKGVMPDIVLPSVLNYSPDIGEASLDYALEWDTIPGATYEKYGMVEPFLEPLLQRSNRRIATNTDFAYVRQDIEQFRKDLADKTVPLNEKERLREFDELEKRQKAREVERLARKPDASVIYDIKLADTDKPGLPEPVVAKSGKTTTVTMSAAGGSTNMVAATQTAPPAKTDEDMGEESWRQKAVLREAQNILVDYIGLLKQKGPLVVNREATP